MKISRVPAGPRMRRTRTSPDTPRPQVTLPKFQYDPDAPQSNIIFSDTKPLPGISIVQRLRTFFWFYPDFLLKLIHHLRPLSYLLLYSLLLLLAWRTVAYANSNPRSVIGRPPEQILKEGVIGNISSLNPLFVTHNQVERDIQALIFNRLVQTGLDGNPHPELAQTWAISKDGKEFTFFLRKDVFWHDGERFTADDVIFTFETVQKLTNQDSYSEEFTNISFGKIDDFTIVVTLPETNPTLMDSLGLPIVPEHILGETRLSDLRFSDFNSFPVGTGPFAVTASTADSIELTRNTKYFESAPKLEKIIYSFFSTESEALEAATRFEVHLLGQVSQHMRSELSGYEAYKTYQSTMDLRHKVVFTNLRGTGALSSAQVRHALSAATDRDSLTASLSNGGSSSLGPIHESSWAFDPEIDRYTFDLTRAGSLLDEAGWTLPGDGSGQYRQKDGAELEIRLSFLDTPENTSIAQALADQWKAAGIQLIADPQSYERISSETVPRRNFEALLFEIECTADPDEYNLWHSTKVDYPGLNLSGYSYERVDIILERARTEADREKRKRDYSLFQRYFMDDMPALYLFHPSYTFIAHSSVKGIELQDMTLPQRRYDTVEQWYIDR
ncbi:MAG: peptide ABC transporter substrate-binding protein [Candidatus Dojkabacteria bacterium]|nr:peptide ABC transporter substrate-binding protein [Candidatus Dojkabacteria bacterium]